MKISMPRFLLLAVLLCGLAPTAEACHGLLRRMFAPRYSCEAAPSPVYVAPKSAVVPKEAPDTLEGRVVLKADSAFHVPKSLEDKIFRDRDKKSFRDAKKEHLLDPTWRVDPATRGIANVVVYLKRPKDGPFPIHPQDRVRKDTLVIDIPCCSFEPHMTAFYPMWKDGKDTGETGQDLVFKNSSLVLHNLRATAHPKYNIGFNRNLLVGPQFSVLKDLTRDEMFNPQPRPIVIQNDIYVWMSAYVWIFDHPYFAISQADGSFKIPRVPAGIEVQVMAWHEDQGWLFTKDGKTMTLKKGKNTLDFEMSAK